MDCIFCKIAKKELPSSTLYEDDKVLAIMDINPICDGHVLVIPKMHVEDIYEVDDELLAHMFKVAKELNLTMMERLNKPGGTFSINYGNMQEVKHLHLHIMSNFKETPTMDVQTVFAKLRG